ncbi:MAG TPA: hypothetical protein VFK04_07805 [Gemmatimonadaceae bacterium]|nr:hypothetical protein [Gemmatimonadaceae bacterium]
MRFLTSFTAIALLALGSVPSVAQTPAHDPSERLRQVLPADVAERVLERIADARAHQLPADALEQRALKFAARGVAPAAIERSVAEQAERMAAARAALASARGQEPSGDEIEAGAEAMRGGVDASAISTLAKSAPSGRSLAVPLYVLGNLAASGVPAADALERVRERLAARASDAEMEKLPAQAASAARGDRPANPGRAIAATRSKGASAAAGGAPTGGPPAGVPANGGAAARPTPAGRPSHPGRPNRP